jgi:hypothetical protein
MRTVRKRGSSSNRSFLPGRKSLGNSPLKRGSPAHPFSNSDRSPRYAAIRVCGCAAAVAWAVAGVGAVMARKKALPSGQGFEAFRRGVTLRTVPACACRARVASLKFPRWNPVPPPIRVSWALCDRCRLLVEHRHRCYDKRLSHGGGIVSVWVAAFPPVRRPSWDLAPLAPLRCGAFSVAACCATVSVVLSRRGPSFLLFLGGPHD